MNPAEELFYIALTGVAMVAIGAVLWWLAKRAVMLLTSEDSEDEAGLAIGLILIAMAYALFPAGLLFIFTESAGLAVGVFVATALVLYIRMYRSG